MLAPSPFVQSSSSARTKSVSRFFLYYFSSPISTLLTFARARFAVLVQHRLEADPSNTNFRFYTDLPPSQACTLLLSNSLVCVFVSSIMSGYDRGYDNYGGQGGGGNGYVLRVLLYPWLPMYR